MQPEINILNEPKQKKNPWPYAGKHIVTDETRTHQASAHSYDAFRMHKKKRKRWCKCCKKRRKISIEAHVEKKNADAGAKTDARGGR